VYERAELPLGVELAGPLVVQEPGSSTIVWPRDRLRIDSHGNLRVEVGEK
jgi:N-methylhydantoinase A/oxoprolinase/acetone carboxylase beta subunit